MAAGLVGKANSSNPALYHHIFLTGGGRNESSYFPINTSDSLGPPSDAGDAAVIGLHNSTTMKQQQQTDAFSTIMPALVQVFSVMAIGYFVGRLGILLPHDMKSINVFVARLALPALIFRAMCMLDFGDVNWLLLLAMFLSKITLFTVTSALTVIFSRRRPFVMSRAALYSIFVTQSNDLAFGYPIVDAIYSSRGYDFVKYLYLMAPITFLLLNPIGFIMLEIDKLRNCNKKTVDTQISTEQRQCTPVTTFATSMASTASPPSDATVISSIVDRDEDDNQNNNNTSLSTLLKRLRSTTSTSHQSSPVRSRSKQRTSARNHDAVVADEECMQLQQQPQNSRESRRRDWLRPRRNRRHESSEAADLPTKPSFLVAACRQHICACRLALNVLKNVFLNNIVLMTFAGIAANFIFQRDLPQVVAGVADVLANSFAAATLFSLGLRMNGQIGSFFGWQALVPVLLIVGKTIFLPILGRQFAVILLSSQSSSLSEKEVEILSNFVFLYGTFPTAPTVFVFAQEFNCEVNVIGTGLVACTFLSAPIMFISSQMASLVNVSNDVLAQIFQTAQFDVAAASAAVLLWVIMVLLLTHRAGSVPHVFTLALVLVQLILVVVKILRTILIQSSYGLSPHSPSMCVMSAAFLAAVMGTRMLVALLSLVLLHLHWYAGVSAWMRRYAVHFITAVIAAALAAAAATVLLSFLLGDNAAVMTVVDVSDAAGGNSSRVTVVHSNYTNTYADIDPTYQFGRAQSIMSALVLLSSLVVISYAMARLQATASSLNSSRVSRRKSLSVLLQNHQNRRRRSQQRSSSSKRSRSRNRLKRSKSSQNDEQTTATTTTALSSPSTSTPLHSPASRTSSISRRNNRALYRKNEQETVELGFVGGAAAATTAATTKQQQQYRRTCSEFPNGKLGKNAASARKSLDYNFTANETLNEKLSIQTTTTPPALSNTTTDNDDDDDDDEILVFAKTATLPHTNGVPTRGRRSNDAVGATVYYDSSLVSIMRENYAAKPDVNSVTVERKVFPPAPPLPAARSLSNRGGDGLLLKRTAASTGHLEDAIADFERRQVAGSSTTTALLSFEEEIKELRLIEQHVILHQLQSWQITRHALLILINGVFMLISFFFNTWRLLSPASQNTAIFFEVQFLDGILTMGQGFVTFAVFGLEPRFVLIPFYRRYRRWFYGGGVETANLPALHELRWRAVRACRLFVRYHVDECRNVLQDKHYVLSKYRNVISGHDFVDFLIESGLATSRQEAVQFGRDLLNGRIIEHVAQEYHFHDFDFFYRLSDDGIELWHQQDEN